MVEFNINNGLRHIFRLHLTVEFEVVFAVEKAMELSFHCMFGSIEEMLVSVIFLTTWIFAKCLNCSK